MTNLPLESEDQKIHTKEDFHNASILAKKDLDTAIEGNDPNFDHHRLEDELIAEESREKDLEKEQMEHPEDKVA